MTRWRAVRGGGVGNETGEGIGEGIGFVEEEMENPDTRPESSGMWVPKTILQTHPHPSPISYARAFRRWIAEPTGRPSRTAVGPQLPTGAAILNTAGDRGGRQHGISEVQAEICQGSCMLFLRWVVRNWYPFKMHKQSKGSFPPIVSLSTGLWTG